MQITEARLQQIVLEEVHQRLLEYYVDQEIERLISEDDDWKAAKWKARKKKIRDASLGALGLGTVAGALGGEVTDYEDTVARDYAEKTAEREAEAESLAKKKQQLETYMNNPAAFRWGVGGETMMQLPGEEGMGGTSVLPASYSVIQQVYLDKMKGLPRYGIPDLEDMPTMTGEQPPGRGDPDENLQTFFSDFSESQMLDAAATLFRRHEKDHPKAGEPVYPHVKRMAASGLESKILMLDPRVLDPNYVLPENGMTVKDYYNWAFFNKFLSAEEREMFDIDNPEREADAPAPTPHTVDITPNKKFTWKESKITWKNYRNRKKILA